MYKAAFKIGDNVQTLGEILDPSTYIVEAVIVTKYGVFYHLQSRDSLVINIANVSEDKLCLLD